MISRFVNRSTSFTFFLKNKELILLLMIQRRKREEERESSENIMFYEFWGIDLLKF